MKRSLDSSQLQEILNANEPLQKVFLVEREPAPNGIALVNPTAVAKKSYDVGVELSQGISSVTSSLQANAKNRLDIIGQQMKNLQDLMVNVFEDTRQSLDLHNAACNFVKKPGQVYHLYKRPSGQKYFGMLSPEEWSAPHEFLGSFRLEADQSWTPAHLINRKYNGLQYLQNVIDFASLA